jgi:deazaflavin-dependent oxidoreductase (nitroreductase family)
MTPDPALASEAFCYLTTTGRVTGNPHTIEIWFALAGGRLYMLSGSGTEEGDRERPRADWVRNLVRTPAVQVRIRDQVFPATGRVVTGSEEDALARRLLVEKYRSAGDDLAAWGRTSLPVALDFATQAG